MVRIAAIFHDLGKATVLFQNKLLGSMRSGKPTSDAVRHELVSAAVWDVLVGDTDDHDISRKLAALTSEEVDGAWELAISKVASLPRNNTVHLELDFLSRPSSIAYAIGILVLTHHRLPAASGNRPTAQVHAVKTDDFNRNNLVVAPGKPFWHEEWWCRWLSMEAGNLSTAVTTTGLDTAMRTALMLADHTASAAREPSDSFPEHLANTLDNKPADSLSQHVRRVLSRCKSAYLTLDRYRHSFPGLAASQLPIGILQPEASSDRFAWQGKAAAAAAEVCRDRPGGFFACLLAGTGTGKTRGAPTILAAATVNDAEESRRRFRMTLGLGLRNLAKQSALDYVDMGFDDASVAVTIGQMPIVFHEPDTDSGSESLNELPEWLQVELVHGRVPQQGDASEGDWIRGLSLDTEASLPAFIDEIGKADKRGADSLKRFLAAPILIGTVDHVASAASAGRSRHTIPSIRLMTSDLVLDEIDQYDAEDLAVMGRLVFLAAAAGRRVIVMSATLTADTAGVLYKCYERGWSEYASASGAANSVNVLCTGDGHRSVRTNLDGAAFLEVLDGCIGQVISDLSTENPLRRAEVLPACSDWDQLIEQIDSSISRLHDQNASPIDGFNVSFGLIRMTRIKHTARVALRVPTGIVRGRLRVAVCLHAQFPRLHREWIERQLKQALTRKGSLPNAGIAKLCREHRVFDRAHAAGVSEIEIVAVTSPVIETGNDIDFDYAIIDGASVRAMVQTPGRVRRHRPGNGQVNVLFLGRSPLAMSGDGKLQYPGPETPAPKSTLTEPANLNVYAARLTSDLLGETDLSVVDARLMLREGHFPLRKAEEFVREQMLDTGNAAPLGSYLGSVSARMTTRPIDARRFRRNNVANIRYSLDLESGDWLLELSPGTRHSKRVPAADLEIINPPIEQLFEAMQAAALADYMNGRDLPERSVMACEVPNYDDADVHPKACYSPFSGFVRGTLQTTLHDHR